MSGHSKWSTIKRKKGANDAQRAKIFTKIARIGVTAKHLLPNKLRFYVGGFIGVTINGVNVLNERTGGISALTLFIVGVFYKSTVGIPRKGKTGLTQSPKYV